MKYIEEKSGKWIYPKRKGYKLMCCDCGLVHRLDFRIIKEHEKNYIEYRVFRDNKATSSARRKKLR